MNLLPDWKQIIRKAWSIRLMLAAAVLTGLEAILPLFAEHFPRGLFAGLSASVIGGALVARIVAQRNMGDEQ